MNEDCSFSEAVKENPPSFLTQMPKFSDIDLQNLLNSKTKGLIYVMNPKFGYSVKFLPEVIDFAQAHSLKITLLVTKRGVSKKGLERQMATVTANLNSKIEPIKVNDSLELSMRQMELHSPSLIFYQKGRLAAEPVIGVHPAKSLSKILKQTMKEI